MTDEDRYGLVGTIGAGVGLVILSRVWDPAVCGIVGALLVIGGGLWIRRATKGDAPDEH